MQVDEEAFNSIRDALVSKILDIGFLSHLNKVGVVLYGAVCPPPLPEFIMCFELCLTVLFRC